VEQLSWDHVEAFVERRTRRQPPVFWWLKSGWSEEVEQGLANQNIVFRRRPESGVLEIVKGEREVNIERLIATLRAEEVRQYSFNNEAGCSGVERIIETKVPESLDSNEYLPVLGAGGRIIFFQTDRGVGAELTIRRRLEPEEARWRDPAEIISRFRWEYQISRPMPRLRAGFGYFELSKYEFQRLMRPVFIFSLEQSQDEERHLPGWRTTIVEPATTSSEFTLQEGMGNWLERTIESP